MVSWNVRYQVIFSPVFGQNYVSVSIVKHKEPHQDAQSEVENAVLDIEAKLQACNDWLDYSVAGVAFFLCRKVKIVLKLHSYRKTQN